jgi:DNA polymerase III delta' subunit
VSARRATAAISDVAPTGWRTRGQDAAVRAVRDGFVRGQLPHAILLAGPAGTGKTTLALDLAAALLCTTGPIAERPCRSCRGCRMVEHGNHPDLHRLAPSGAGAVIGIGGRDRGPGVRGLIEELALLPAEGGARVAIVESAERLTEDAQSAFLKTLEEPPPGVTFVLCADEADRLLPTIRSRCARIRLGPVASRTIEAILADAAGTDAPTAARLARIAGGRPGVALTYARAPEAATVRAEIARGLLDLGAARRFSRLSLGRDLLARAGDLVRALDGTPNAPRPRRGAAEPDAAGEEPGAEASAVRAPAAERRRAAFLLLSIWRDVARDLALVQRRAGQLVRDRELLDDYNAAAQRVPPEARDLFIARLARSSELLEGNVSPELALDGLALAWERAA